jgi:RNA polymerase sigma-70 factor (ECF subfamily)
MRGDMNDVQLLAGITRQNHADFAEFVSRYTQPIMNFVYRFFPSHAQVEDIAQDVFLRVWQHAASWHPKDASSPRAWLYRIAYNRCIDLLRQEKNISNDVENLVSHITPELTLLENKKQQQVKHAMNQLPERQRTALYLYTYQGLTNKEAAETLGISVDALESLLARARRQLRNQLISDSEVETNGKRSINE